MRDNITYEFAVMLMGIVAGVLIGIGIGNYISTMGV